jgi:O-antigen ligase
MSPMLHENVYGFQARLDWAQNIRQGGYRPTVFMGHGLVVGFFMFICTTAAITLHKAGKRKLWGVPMWLVVLYLFVMLVLIKAMAALIYGAVGFLLIRYLSVKNQLRVLVLLALVVISYPFSRMTNVFPTQAILDAAGTFGKDRVESMQFRFDNEDILILKGTERPIFGWGGFSRERVYSEETGKDLVIQDGAWIGLFGTHGVLGFVCFFAVLVIPIFQAARKMNRIKSKSDRIMMSGLAFLVTVCCVNMLPYMGLPNLQFFFAAGLATLLNELPKQAADERRASQRTAKEKDGSSGRSPAPQGLRHA